MIPPLVLDVQPGQIVLDMCAAPGSKTAQLLESIVSSGEKFPEGLVIANDCDHKRAYMLVHQSKRLQTPCLIVTNHDAQEFPKIWVESEAESFRYIQFDRILADVPCSGDGTLRKNKTIFRTWSETQGNGLHRTQLLILRRAFELLKVGGRIVYSTCTFNPVENEAVVANALNETEGALKLVDVSNELPHLKRCPGMTKWKVKKNGKFYDSFLENEGLQTTMFPPQNIETLNIDRCMRVYPHHQNTGGFFVAVIEKISGFGSLDTGKGPRRKGKRQADEIAPLAEVKKASGWRGVNELPFLFLGPNSHSVKECLSAYGIHSSFPQDLFVTRSEEDINFKHIYIVSSLAKKVLTSENANSLKLINTGVRMFSRGAGKGAYVILTYDIAKRLIFVSIVKAFKQFSHILAQNEKLP
jgi:16S rRNA C967 or C1407 C5-methylase (RsmB/RsmF family)